MSVSYFVRYDIAVQDLPAFLERYREVHMPLVSAWPGLQRVVMHSGNAVLMQFEFDSGTAIDEAKNAVSLDPASLEANLNLAIVYMKTHQFDDSIAQFRHVLSADPSNGIANYQLPWVLAFNGQ